ncbi:hypothetical protein BDM02DRAFT_1981864 [Thelephora ganbajun]|uniref:Uncharacterized protein n=1 Tax=Thelephora ganbajun TaxID=370292 RepID=A0ACB6ZHT2_THEGA|nr:hypothetical protein BDM02DRAFT_1981864 [Thelephora ganbajun]
MYHSAATVQISTLRQVTESLLEVGKRGDKPTGDTPRKKTRKYQDQWELTKSRDVVPKEWRQRGGSAKDSEAYLAEHLPLPDGDEEVAMDDGDAVIREADGEAEEVEEEVPTRSVASPISSPSSMGGVAIWRKRLSPPLIPASPVPAPVLKRAHKRTSSTWVTHYGNVNRETNQHLRWTETHLIILS